MRLWAIAIWNSIPPKWWVVLAPFGAIIVAFVFWFFFGGLIIEPEDPRIDRYIAEYSKVLPKAVEGDKRSQYRVAVMLRDGRMGQKELGAALTWMERAAKDGYPPAQLALGRMHAGGIGVRQDYSAAAKWYGAAAGFGKHREAQYEFGNLYFYGRGIGQDYSEAIKWFRRAALRGHAGAQIFMGSMYEKGWGTEQNLAESYAWYRLAAAQPRKARLYRKDVNVKAILEELKPRMTRLDIKNGNRRLRELQSRIRAEN
jgi:TPR repeat protein